MKFPASNYYPSPHIPIAEPIPKAIASEEIFKSDPVG